MPPPILPPPAPPPMSLPAPAHGSDASLGSVVATLLVLVVVLGSLVWLAKPWRKLRLPRARAQFKPPDDPKRDTPES